MQRTNRKIIRALLAGFLLFLIAGICCMLSGCAPEEYVEITYFAEEGGAVYGNTYQKIASPKDATYVLAVPNEGYGFVGWSDGNEEAKRIDGDAAENSIFTAQFMKLPFYTITYRVEGEGGKIWGSYKQRVREGNDGFPVIAKSANGYRFVGWSDGVSDAERYEAEVLSDVELTAKFEPIQVNFYSGDYLVRKLALPQINETDTDKLVGYQSNSVFERWKFTGNYAGAMKGYKGDALALLQNHFNVFGIADIEDVDLIASYTPATGGSVPENFKTIAHGLGGVDGNTYLNSEEAFLYYYEKGQRFFEADISFTDDGIPVVCHAGLFASRNPGQEYTYENFMNSGKEGFTVMDLTDLLNLINEHDDIVMDFDILAIGNGPYGSYVSNYAEFFQRLKTEIDEINPNLFERIIFEINYQFYRNDVLSLAKASGAVNLLCTEVNTTDAQVFSAALDWCEENGVKYLSTAVYYPDMAEATRNCDVYIFVFTYNDPMQMYGFFDLGADCIFTDFSYM